LPSPPANQCVRLAPSESFGNPDSLRSGRAVAARIQSIMRWAKARNKRSMRQEQEGTRKGRCQSAQTPARIRDHSGRRKSRRPQSHGLPDSSPERISKTLATGYPKWLGQTPQAAPFNQLAIIVKATRFTFFGSPRLRYRAVANGFSSVAVAAVMDA